MQITNLLLMMSMVTAYGRVYRCPEESQCLTRDLCPEGNITFDVARNFDQQIQPIRFSCGWLLHTEGHVCCGNTDRSEVFDYLNQLHDDFIDEWPTSDEASYEEQENLHICPYGSICVPPFMCYSSGIAYTHLMPEQNLKYECGDREMTGFVCCSIFQLAAGVFAQLFASEIPDENYEIILHINQLETPYRSYLSPYGSSYKNRFLSVGKFDPETYRGVRARRDVGKKSETINSNKDEREVSSQLQFPKATVYEGVQIRKNENLQEWACGQPLQEQSVDYRLFSPLGDRRAEEGAYPWHVAILTKELDYLCSGVIIDKNIAITVAHCIINQYPSNILVRVGDLDLSSTTEKLSAYDVQVTQIVVHPDYREWDLFADIAVLELKYLVNGLVNVKPACLPDATTGDHKNRPDLNRCKVAGWGQTVKTSDKEEQLDFSYRLRDSSFYVVSRTDCQRKYRRHPNFGAFFKLNGNVICAKGYSNADTCRGDGGSGLVCFADDTLILTGLVSWGFGCGTDLPGVYTDVSKFLLFLKNYKNYQNVQYEPPETESAKPQFTFEQDYEQKPKPSKHYTNKPTVGEDTYNYLSAQTESSQYQPVDHDENQLYRPDHIGYQHSPRPFQGHYQFKPTLEGNYHHRPANVEPQYHYRPIFGEEHQFRPVSGEGHYHLRPVLGNQHYHFRPSLGEEHNQFKPASAEQNFLSRPVPGSEHYNHRPEPGENVYQHRPGSVHEHDQHRPESVEQYQHVQESAEEQYQQTPSEKEQYQHTPSAEEQYLHTPSEEEQYQHKPDSVEEQYQHRPEYIQEQYQHRPEYIEEQYQYRPESVEKHYQHVQMLQHFKPATSEEFYNFRPAPGKQEFRPAYGKEYYQFRPALGKEHYQFRPEPGTEHNQFRPSPEKEHYQFRPSPEQHHFQFRPSSEQQHYQFQPSLEQQHYQFRPSPEQQHYQFRPSPEKEHYQFRPSPEKEYYQFRPSPEKQHYQFRPSHEKEHYQFRPSPEKEHYQFRPSPEKEHYQFRPSPEKEHYQFRPSPEKEQYQFRPSPEKEQYQLRP